MVVALYFTLLLLNTLFAVLNKNNRIVIALTVVGQALIMCGNNMNADYQGYYYFYLRQTYPESMEIGYVWLSKLAYDLGMDYQTFRIVLLLVGVIAMYAITSYLSENVHLVSLLYLSTMMFLDVVQIRQFIAFVIMTFAILSHSKGKKIIFCLLILLGATFQMTILVYLPLVFLNADQLSSKVFIKSFFIGIIIVCAFVFVSGSSLSFIKNFMAQFIESDKMIYFSTRARFGFLKYYPFQFLCIYLSWLIQNFYVNRGFLLNRGTVKSFAESTYLCILYSSIAMPLIMLNNNFLRFFKFGLIALFICFSCLSYDSKNEYHLNHRANIPLSSGYMGGKGFLFLFCTVIIIGYGIMMQVNTEAYNVLHYNMLFS